MHLYITSGGPKRVTISNGGGCFWEVMKVKGSSRRFSYRSILPTFLIACVLLPFLFLRTALLALEGASNCSATVNCIGWRLRPGFLRGGDASKGLEGELRRAFTEAKEEVATGGPAFRSFSELVTDVASDPHQDIKTFILKTKKMLLKMDRMVQLARHQGSIYRHLASIGVPKSMHCLSLRLAEEYSTNARARTPLPLVDSISRLSNNSYHHIAILTDNILAASVVISSTMKSCSQPEKVVFHVITDKKTYAPMHAWFALNPVNPAVVEVKGLHQCDWPVDVKNAVMEMTEVYSSMREHRHRSDGGSEDYSRLEALRPSCFSLLNHLRMFLPHLFPELERVVFLDDDVVVQGDLSPLWGLDLQGKANGAVGLFGEDEVKGYCYGGRYADYLNFSNPIVSDRFEPEACAWLYGMNIFNLHAWREAAITQSYVRWLKMNQESGFTLWRLGSLAPALISFYGHIHPIDSSWHLSGLGHRQSDVDSNALNAAAVIHFSGPAKPWLEIGSPKLRSLWTAHLNFSSEYILGCRIME